MLAEFEKARFSPLVLLRQQAIDAAFEAMVSCGRFNRLHKEHAILPSAR
jgi:hypothetical protein